VGCPSFLTNHFVLTIKTALVGQ